MSEISLEQVKFWFEQAYEDDELVDLGYEIEGTILDFDSVPDEYSVKIVATNTHRNYDSYGDMSLQDGYIVFSVTDSAGNVENFKLPIEYSSYEGWDIDYNRITKTEKREKVITTWEWQNV